MPAPGRVAHGIRSDVIRQGLFARKNRKLQKALRHSGLEPETIRRASAHREESFSAHGLGLAGFRLEAGMTEEMGGSFLNNPFRQQRLKPGNVIKAIMRIRTEAFA